MKKKKLFLMLVLMCVYSIVYAWTAADVSAGSIDGTVSGVVQDNVSISRTEVTCGETSSVSVNTNSDGIFRFGGVLDGTYIVKPEKTGYIFSPLNRSVTIYFNNVRGVDFTSAVARFVDNGDGTVTDLRTNLIWLKDANCVGPQNWETAALFALGLGNGGCDLSDGSAWGEWRLPTKAELQGIGTDPPATWYSLYPSVTWWIPSVPFTNGDPNFFYWSSTDNAANADYVWVTLMLDGYTNNATKDVLLNVWPVRSAN